MVAASNIGVGLVVNERQVPAAAPAGHVVGDFNAEAFYASLPQPVKRVG